MHNELCERLGIEFPIFAFTHCRDVAAAVSNTGGMGVLGAVGFSPINHHPPTQINEVVGGKRRKQGAAASVLELIA